MMRVYECDLSKQKDMKAVLEADPYSADSFARAGYKLRDGATLGEAKDKMYLYISASDEFLKKADQLLKDVAKRLSGKDEERIIAKIKEEEETAESGFGSLFGG